MRYALIALLVTGCSAAHVPADSGAATLDDANLTHPDGELVDAGPRTYAQACGDLRNAWDTYCASEPFTAAECPFAPTDEPPAMAVRACSRALYEARDSCAGMRAALAGCW